MAQDMTSIAKVFKHVPAPKSAEGTTWRVVVCRRSAGFQARACPNTFAIHGKPFCTNRIDLEAGSYPSVSTENVLPGLNLLAC